jgi:hypothetical protein
MVIVRYKRYSLLVLLLPKADHTSRWASSFPKMTQCCGRSSNWHSQVACSFGDHFEFRPNRRYDVDASPACNEPKVPRSFVYNLEGFRLRLPKLLAFDLVSKMIFHQPLFGVGFGFGAQRHFVQNTNDFYFRKPNTKGVVVVARNQKVSGDVALVPPKINEVA